MKSPFVSILYLDQITLKFQNWYFNDKILKITWISIKKICVLFKSKKQSLNIRDCLADLTLPLNCPRAS